MSLVVGLVVGLVAVHAVEARYQDHKEVGDSEALGIAREVTTAGAKLFSAKDAKGLTDTYVDNARIELVSRDSETSELKRDVREGRSAILDAYQELFKNSEPLSAVNHVEYARLLGPDILEISGTLVITQNGMHRLPFTQYRVKDGNFWRITEVRVFVTPEH